MREEITNRFLQFAVSIHKLERTLSKSYSGRHIYGQLFRSGTSAGANYNEATAAESKKDFIHKMQLSLKELREARYWIRFSKMVGIVPESDEGMAFLFQESFELLNIMGKAVSTAKKNRTA